MRGERTDGSSLKMTRANRGKLVEKDYRNTKRHQRGERKNPRDEKGQPQTRKKRVGRKEGRGKLTNKRKRWGGEKTFYKSPREEKLGKEAC